MNVQQTSLILLFFKISITRKKHFIRSNFFFVHNKIESTSRCLKRCLKSDISVDEILQTLQTFAPRISSRALLSVLDKRCTFIYSRDKIYVSQFNFSYIYVSNYNISYSKSGFIKNRRLQSNTKTCFTVIQQAKKHNIDLSVMVVLLFRSRYQNLYFLLSPVLVLQM